MLKDRLFALTERLPLVGRAADPFMATVLAGFVALVLVALVVPAEIFPGDRDARSHLLQLAGGLIVVGGFYFTAVGWRTSRADHHADRLLSTIGKLESSSEAVRLGAIGLLESMAHDNPNLPKDTASLRTAAAQQRAIMAALAAAGEEGETKSAAAARAACVAIRAG